MEKDDEVLHGDGEVEEAIPLVIFNEDKKIFELNEEGREFLKGIKGPIGVIAVAGMYRTGKSYLLNRMLLDRNKGFGVGPTINPCTKGVWIWGKPVMGTTPEGDPITVLVMDTEGLGALDEDSNHDVRIFSLAILLSSYFIYNSVGSIDENALQNLSLVINLTKNIQIKASGIGQDDIDPEAYAQYFPSFMWVVRDFTLQLVDQEGEQISSKEYLEKALANQKGFSDSIEQKNRIRRLLKTFFTDRDAVTMIRPLTDENRLQNLINIPMDELRPEFVEQVTILRRKVLGRVRPKKLNGKNLNGTMFWNLMKSYVESINNGAIPSIETSWAYICKNECQKAQDESYDMFNKAISEDIANGGPFYEHELKDIYSSAKHMAIDKFQKVAVGDVKPKYFEDLKEKMKQKYNQIKQDNEQSCEQECIMFLRQSYTEIERALKNQQYPSFIDYLHDIEQFKVIFDENGPPGSNRKEILLDFCIKAVMESAEFFIGQFSNEIQLQRTLADEAVKKLQGDIKELKTDQKDKFDQIENKLRRSEMQKAELDAREQSAREQLAQVQNEKTQLESELQGKMNNIKKDYERRMEDLEQKMTGADDQKKEIQRQKVAAESEYDKQKALLDQKIEFLEKALEDSSRREKEMSTELKNCKKDFLSQNRDANQQLEKQIKDQIKQIDQMKEVIYEHESKNNELDMQLEEEKNAHSDKVAQLNSELKKASESEANINKKLQNLQKKYDQECKNLKESQDNEQALTTERMAELEQQLKETQETFDIAKQSWAKDEAVLRQKFEFVQYQLDDEKKKYEESEKTHRQMVHSIQSTNRDSVIGRTEAEGKMSELEAKYIHERKMQEDQYNEYRNKMKQEIDQLMKKNNEIELAIKLKNQEYNKDVGTLKEQFVEAETARESAEKQLKDLNTKGGQSMQASEERFKQKEREYEQEIDEKEREIEDLIQEHNVSSEKKLGELKRFYDDEKERLERRIGEEKSRSEKKLNQTIEDYEEKVQEMSNNHEEAYNILEEEKNSTEDHLQNIMNQLEKENQVMQQQIESKDKYLNELKENYNSLQEQSNRQTDYQSDKFSKERKELNEKLENLTSEIAKRERAIVSIENQKETLINQIKNKEQNLDESKAETMLEKQTMYQKIEDLKSKYESTMDELTQGKIDFERDKALKDQKLMFQEQRIKEYHEQMSQSIERYEERLKSEKDDAQKTLHERIFRIQQEKENVETKYEQKRKALKDLEKTIQQSSSQFEREKAVQNEKYGNLETSQRELIKTYEIENQKLQEYNDQLNLTLSQGELGIREQVEHWKGQYYEIERQHADLQSEFDKEKALWEDKFEFYKKQKEQAKKDQEDNLKQFQQTIEQLQKTQNETKSKHETNHSNILTQLQEKFKNEMSSASQNNDSQLNQLQQTIRRLEKDNKALTEKIELSSKFSMSEQGGLEKRIDKVMEERDRLREDFDQFKNDQEKKVEDMKRQYDREKDLLKQKNYDLQQKGKNTDSKQTEMILSHETNRAKWDQEKSYLLTAKEDALSELKNIQRKYENSIKEIERLKEKDKKANWRMQNNKRIGQMDTNNPLLYKLGNDVLGRLNLGGGGAGTTGRAGDLRQSENNLNLGKGEGAGALGASFRENMGTDKSMDTGFKSGFQSKFAGGGSGLNFGSLSSVSNPQPGLGLGGAGGVGGAVPGQGAIGASNLKLGLGALQGNSAKKSGPQSMTGNMNPMEEDDEN